MFTDTHCHIFKKEFANNEEILINLNKDNIKRIIVNAYDYQTNLEVMKLVEQCDNVYGALGIHPNHLDESFDETLKLIEKNISNPKIVAIGEIGLDYYHDKNSRDKQLKSLYKLLDIAQKFNMPVIIHSRNATQDTLEVLSSYNLKGIIHCFSGSYEVATEYINLGFKLGINGIVTFKNSKLWEVIKKISVDNILLETDAPYLTPEPFRKYQNEPKYINDIARKVAEFYGVDLINFADILEKNLKDIFDNFPDSC